MAGPRKLRVVAPDEKQPLAALAKSIVEAAESGVQLELLVAMRTRVATAVQDPNCPPRDLAALTRRLQEIGREIEAIELRVQQEGDEDAETPDEDWDTEAI